MGADCLDFSFSAIHVSREHSEHGGGACAGAVAGGAAVLSAIIRPGWNKDAARALAIRAGMFGWKLIHNGVEFAPSPMLASFCSCQRAFHANICSAVVTPST